MRSDREIIEQWSPNCSICGEIMEDRHLVRVIVPFEIARSKEYTRVYVCCSECYRNRELV